MKQITIDCAFIETAVQFHTVLREALSFPEWYGSNLDALYDCLTSIKDDTELTLEHFLGLGDFGARFLRVFADAAQDNPHLTVTIL